MSGEDDGLVAHSVQRVVTEGLGMLSTLLAAQQQVPFPKAYGWLEGQNMGVFSIMIINVA